MVHEVKAVVTNFCDLNLIPGTNIVEEENLLLQVDL